MNSLAARVNRASTVLGVVVWFILFWLPRITLLPRLLLLATLVVVPLALWLTASADRLNAGLRLLQPLAAAMSVIAFLNSVGVMAGALAVIWLMFTGLIGLHGLARLRTPGFRNLAELCVTVGMLYAPIGGVWLAAARLGIGLLGFGEPLVSLTAMHFHYAGFAALIIAGLTGRALAEHPQTPRRVFNVVAVGLMAGMALVAAGITLSPALEVVAAITFAASLIGLELLQLRYIVPQAPRLAQILFLGSALMAGIAMLAAVTYALGEFTGGGLVTLPQMLHLHGEANALGFVLANLLGWVVWAEKAR